MKYHGNPKLILFLALGCATLTAATPVLAAAQPAAGLDLAKQLNDAFASVAERVSPTVVVISVIQRPEAAADADENDGAFDELPPGFLRQFHEQLRRHHPEFTQAEGSGVIVRSDGYILTNVHVVKDAEKINVKLRDGRTFKAAIRGVDVPSDIAVLKIDAQGLPVCSFGDSDRARVGEFALAIGAPFSLDYSVTVGHISAKGRSNIIETSEGATMDQDFIQTDALINPGNSGGPLVNIEGELIGVNTLIRGLHTGIGFAVPSNLAREVADQLIARGKFPRPWLGLGIRALRDLPELQARFKEIHDGVVVVQIIADGPAAQSQLRPTDVICRVAGEPVATPQELRTVVRTKPIGQPLLLDVFRGGKNLSVKVVPEESDPSSGVLAQVQAPEPKETERGNLGISVQELTSDLRARFDVRQPGGVLVAGVEADSPAARQGLKAGDVITSVDQHDVTSAKQYRNLIKGTDLQRGVLLNLLTDHMAHFVILKEAGP